MSEVEVGFNLNRTNTNAANALVAYKLGGAYKVGDASAGDLFNFIGM
jgi:hypothetical protein